MPVLLLVRKRIPEAIIGCTTSLVLPIQNCKQSVGVRPNSKANASSHSYRLEKRTACRLDTPGQKMPLKTRDGVTVKG